MIRLEKLQPSMLTPEQTILYARIVHGPRHGTAATSPLVDESGGLEGPFNAMLLSPTLGTALQELGSTVRFSSSLPPRARELAILIVAHHSKSEYERRAHEVIGLDVGLTHKEIESIRGGHLPKLHDEVESVVVNVAVSLTTESDLDDATFVRCTKVLGAAGVFEMMTLVGYYQMLALQMRVFRV